MDMDETRSRIRRQFKSLGATVVGFAPADLPSCHTERFKEWCAAGYCADMNYLPRRIEHELTLDDLLPGTRSMIIAGFNYFTAEEASSVGGRVSRYAVFRDYHKVIKKKLRAMEVFIKKDFGADARGFVDSGPVLERGYASAAGLGMIGRNTLLITKEYGSWLFLSTILTTLEIADDLTPEEPIRCCDCGLCIPECPTNAISPAGVVDGRRCISYLTIENRGGIPVELRPLLGNHIFGCDRCQEICPHNRRAPETDIEDFRNLRIAGLSLPLAEILSLEDDDAFVKRFAGMPIMRAKRIGLLRNACVVAGNSADTSLIEPLRELIERETDPMLLEHAGWALSQLR